MPHVIVKLYPGRTEDVKKEMAEAISECVVRIGKCSESAVSVSVEEVAPDDWDETVYQPEILGQKEKLYKKPSYNDFE